MQGVSYLPGNLYRVDHIGGANGSLLQLVNNGGTCNLSSLDQHLAYNKELVRQTMLKQEAVFRAQVCELHRLYARQRELMDEIRGREQFVDHIRKQSSQPCYFQSKMVPAGVSQNPVQMPQWLLVNPGECMTPGSNIEKLLTSVLEQSSYRDSSVYLGKNYLREDDGASSSKRRNLGKKILDLELPADAYIDDNDDDDDEQVLMEQNPLETPRISLDPFNRTTWTNNPGQNLSKESSCNANYLLDLNESPQLGESETAKYNSCVESRSSITGLMQKDVSARFGSISSHPDENIRCGVNKVNDTHGHHPTSFSAFNTSCSFADRKTLLHKNALETCVVIQGLPCFNIPESLSENPKFSRINSGFKRKIEPEGPSSMGSATTGMNENGVCENVTEHHSNKRYIEEPNAAKSSNEMDLNVTPSSCLTETENMLEDHTGKINKIKSQPDSGIELVSSQSCALVSSSGQMKSSENEDVLNHTKPGVSCSSHSSDQSVTNSKKDSNSNFAIEEELAKAKISGTEGGSNLVLSVTPDDKEHSPFNGNPEDNVNEISFQLSVQKIGNPDEDIEKISAETIISLSKPRPQDFLKASRTPSDCLDWFADIICSAAASCPEINLDKLSTMVPGGIKQSRKYMTLKCTKAKVDDQLSAIKITRIKRTAWSSGIFVQQANSRRSKKQMQMMEFHSEDSLAACVMNTCGRNLNKKSRVKKSQSRSRSTFMSPPNRRTKKTCVGPDHFTNVNEARCPLSYSCLWGKKNTRQKGRRARADNLSRLWQI